MDVGLEENGKYCINKISSIKLAFLTIIPKAIFKAGRHSANNSSVIIQS